MEKQLLTFGDSSFFQNQNFQQKPSFLALPFLLLLLLLFSCFFSISFCGFCFLSCGPKVSGHLLKNKTKKASRKISIILKDMVAKIPHGPMRFCYLANTWTNPISPFFQLIFSQLKPSYLAFVGRPLDHSLTIIWSIFFH